ncbi:ATP-binding protein [Pseudonocardia sp. NPDC046786]|uniref:ATP-binding protein n=1 Tax=Pseudonocardia sp. NPDC046786 TaxID=3155471 RepID=UPI0033E8945B
MTAAPSRAGTAGFAAAVVVGSVCAVGWLLLGSAAAVVGYLPGAAGLLPAGDRAGGLLTAASAGAPLAQVVPDYACSALNLAVAGLLLGSGARQWALRLSVLAMIGAAAGFNLQARTAAVLLDAVAGVRIGTLLLVALPVLACACAVAALPAFAGRWRDPLSLGTAAVVLLLCGTVTVTAGPVAGCVLLSGLLVPVLGLVVLRDGGRGPGGDRTRSRLVSCTLLAILVTVAVLLAVTVALVVLGAPGLTVDVPVAPGAAPQDAPAALLFWFARIASAAVAPAMLVAVTGTRRRPLLSRGIVVALVAATTGGAVAVLQAGLAAAGPGSGTGWAVVAAALPIAAVLLPLRARVEDAVDRYLYGRRPTPYSGLAGIAALSRDGGDGSPDLARATETVGRGLGASVCRLTVHRPGLRDRTYAWTADGAGLPTDPDALVRVPVRHGDDDLGEVTVDRAAVEGLRTDRNRLLADVADSLAVVLQASRSAIELERQLRAAVAHGERIATARRDAVAAMDRERRRIERDLHDGAQHHLVTLGLALGLVEHEAGAGRTDQAVQRLDMLLERVDAAEAVLAETAGGVSAGIRAEQGLVTALRDALSGGDPPVVVAHDGVPADRCYPGDIGDTAYFCCLEAVGNARKHAPGAAVRVDVEESGGMLRMAVRDEGPGFEPGPSSALAGTPGRGLRNLTTRLLAVGGTVAVRSAPGSGTTVMWSLPVPGGTGTGAAGVAAVAGVAGVAATEREQRGVRAGERARVDPGAADTGGPATGAGPHPQPAGADRAGADRTRTGQLTGSTDGGLVGRVLELLRAAEAVLPDPGPVRAAAERLATAAGDGHTGGSASRDRASRENPDRVDVHAARTALRALEDAVAQAPRDRTEDLRYRIEQLRAGAHELVEVELTEILRDGGAVLPGQVREAAERMLGGHGTDPRDRLGLPADADADAIGRAAAEELLRWQRRAAHPASTGTVRDIALVVVRVCERILTPGG